MKKRRFAVPHVYILLIGLILLFSLLTYVIPASTYDMQTITIEETGKQREVVDPDTYRTVDATPVTLMQFLTAIPRGLQETAQIIFFIFIVGGSMSVLMETKAIEAGIGRLARVLKGKSILIIPVAMLFFSICGSTWGLAEETIVFIPIFISLCLSMGYDSLTGVGLVLCGASAGFSGAFINPFTLQVAQGICGLPLLSAMTFRIVMCAVLTLIAMAFIILHARRVQANPQSSPVYDIDRARTDSVDLNNLPPFGAKEKLILLVFVLGMVLLVYGVVEFGWYMDEIAALFLGMSFLVAIIARTGFNNYAVIMGRGMADVAAGALVVGFARGILVVMTDGQILDTILHAAAGLLGGLPNVLSAIGMYVFQCLLNFLVPSGSGQASISLPILAPLGDMVGVSRQTACIAFQLGDGISNIFTPTSGYFMAGLAVAKIPWSRWAKWVLPFIAASYLAGLVFVIVANAMQLGPF
ncbi:YfcC family protein [Oscillibacter sp.]|uniref:YfcC family protein n=1 Tax=Oscillibacter sp. TaxID=1945593 RepID=UPI00216F40EF|nr:AbgT family transporter [Oscillibacter sp.]MCI9650192.1 putative basic amino acid antiporter YfcC [Oscillibacter sp.]